MFSNQSKVIGLAAIIGGSVLLGLLANVSAQNSASGRSGAAPVEVAGAPANYQLVPGDTVSVRVFREPDLDTQQRLSKDGTIKLPLLGVVRIVGQTTNEAAAAIARLLDKDYVVNPQVSVSVSNYFRPKYTILGQVNSPGSYEIPEETTVDILAAIAKAGGYTRLARLNHVIVTRSTGGSKQTFILDVQRMIKDPNSERFIIQANDSITITEKFI